MEPKIVDLTIKNYRALRHLEIRGLGRVNLITGRNNTGKSSLLEALRILGSEGSTLILREILRLREELAPDSDSYARATEPKDPFPCSSLFSAYPELSSNIEPIEISTAGSMGPARISLRIGWYRGEGDLARRQRNAVSTEEFFDGDGEIPGLVVSSREDSQRLVTAESFSPNPFRSHPLRSEYGDELRLPCHYVGPYGGERTVGLAPKWDKIALSDGEQYVLDALRIIVPGISAVTMVGGEGSGAERTAIVRSRSTPRPVPLRSYGDGMNRLFGIALSLVNAKGGLLLIDEFENGLHHTVQADAWRIIFKLATDLDIQVVATSHSWDAIEAFQSVACNDPEDGVLVRLTRKGDDVIPTVFREDELAIATRDGIEVR